MTTIVETKFLEEIDKFTKTERVVVATLFRVPGEHKITTLTDLMRVSLPAVRLSEVRSAVQRLSDWVKVTSGRVSLLRAATAAPLLTIVSKEERGAKGGRVDRGGVGGKEGEEGKEGKTSAKTFVTLWAARFKEHFGRNYVVVWGRDMKAANFIMTATNLLPTALVSQAMSAWENKKGFWCKRAATIVGFSYSYNEIISELALTRPVKKTELSADDWNWESYKSRKQNENRDDRDQVSGV